jgi:hypothetical protein
VKAVPLLSRGSRSSAMPCGGLDDVDWATTRAGLFTNSPKELHIEPAYIVGQRSIEIKDVATETPIVISHRSELLTTENERERHRAEKIDAVEPPPMESAARGEGRWSSQTVSSE